MTVLRCSRKLLAHMRAVPAASEPMYANPLGPWSADIGFIDREPFVLVMNAATGVMLVLSGRAEQLKRLHVHAEAQLAALLDLWNIRTPRGAAELAAWRAPPALVRNVDRSLVSSMNQRRAEAWAHFAYNERSPFEVAVRLADSLFTRKALGKDYHLPRKLLQAELAESAQILPFRKPPRAVN